MPQNGSDGLRHLRDQMVEQQLRQRGIGDGRVLDVMRRVPRHEFIAPQLHEYAYHDGPLSIGDDQTISQPFIVAFMTAALRLRGNETVLEIGTGSGYQTAILCELAWQVYSIERYEQLAITATQVLEHLGYENLSVHVGDGSQGLADMAPYDAIIVTAAAPSLPGPLCSQLNADGGRMIIPIGDRQTQRLVLTTRQGKHWQVRESIPVRFVPLVGRFGFAPKSK